MSAVSESTLSKVCHGACKVGRVAAQVLLGALVVAGIAAAVFAAIATTVSTGGLPLWIAAIGTAVATGSPVTMLGLTISFKALIWSWAGVSLALLLGLSASDDKKAPSSNRSDVSDLTATPKARRKQGHWHGEIPYNLTDEYLKKNFTKEEERTQYLQDFRNAGIRVDEIRRQAVLPDVPLDPNDEGNPIDETRRQPLLASVPLDPNNESDPRNAFSDQGLTKRFGANKIAATKFVRDFGNEAGINRIREDLGQGPVQGFLDAMH